MVELVTGVRLAAATAAAMLGTEETVRVPPRARAAAIRCFAYENTVVHRLGDLEAARALPGVVTVRVTASEGQKLGRLEGSGSRQGYVLALGDDVEEAVERAEAAHRAAGFVVDG
ncbi:hypothetical protein KEF29_35245 [Streptomyces tuirus]|uniref:L-amino acid ligase C-terminal domain-containing protein n=1 Tax=Streptomyces tuirus TaxID=68278 RepID=A0A941FDQ6_9ACTN|nr:hypothetical protein [Streptomyces tuirus]